MLGLLFVALALALVILMYHLTCDFYDTNENLQIHQFKQEPNFWDEGPHTKMPGYNLPPVKGWTPQPKSIPGTLVILGAARDCATGLKTNIQRLKELGSQFENHHIYIYENGSKDHTRAMLRKAFPHVGDTSDPIDKTQSLWQRMQKVRENTKQEFLHQHGQQKVDYVLLVDMDLVGGIHPRSLEQIFKEPRQDWDALFANGLSYKHMSGPRKWLFKIIGISNRSYDSLAFEDTQAQTVKHPYCLLTRKPIDFTRDVPVNSSFGGAALYKADAFLSADYLAEAEAQHCEHRVFHKSMREKGFDRLFISRKFLVVR